MMSLINGVFDLVRMIDVAVHHSLFKDPMVATVIIGLPICLLGIAVMSYYMYKDANSYMDQNSGSAWRDSDPERAPLSGGIKPPSSFTPFQGSGNRLGS